MKSSDGNFEIWAEQWSNDADDGGFKNCRIKVFIKNISGENIMGWKFEAKASRKSKPEGYEDINRNHGRLSAGATDEIVFQDYCYMKKDSIKVYKTR